MGLRNFLVAFTFCCCCTLAEATELCPWFGRDLEIEGRAATWLQAYRSIDTGHGSKQRPACDAFLDLSASFSYDFLAAQLEAIAADTRHKHVEMDAVRLTGRYRWWNDIIGDPVTLTTGLTVSQVFSQARHDLAIFNHGGIECEIHAAVGKEFSCEQFWTSRIWGVCGAGFADLGSPWLRAKAVWERNWWDRHQLRLFVDTLWGLGGNSLNLKHHFTGYGPIRHQSVDPGIRYSYAFENSLALSVEYGFRVYAKNCPAYVNRIMLQLFYPFGL